MGARPGRGFHCPGAAGDGHSAGPAPARTGERISREHSAAGRLPARQCDCRLSAHPVRLRALLRPLRRVWTVVVAALLTVVLASMGDPRVFRSAVPPPAAL